MFLASEDSSKICKLIEEFNDDILFIINELSKILDEFGTGTCGAESYANVFELLYGVKSFFGIFMAEIIKKCSDLVFLFHSSILEN